MRRDPVLLVWALGLLLAALVYLVGADRFLFNVLNTLHLAAWRISEFIDNISTLTLDMVRALAIGLYVTFVALCLLARRRGARARGALLVISLVFFLLVNAAPRGDDANARWGAALLVVAIGAAVISHRLRAAPPRAVPPASWPER